MTGEPRERLDETYDREYFEAGTRSGYRGLTTSLYGRSYAAGVGLLRAAAIRLFLRPSSLLDVGCGPGHMVGWLRRWGVDAHGVDVSTYIIGRAGESTRPYLHQAEVTALPFVAQRFELVTSFDVLEHIPPEELPAAVLECARMASRYVFHRVCLSDSLHHRTLGHEDASHVSLFPGDWWRRLFAGLGFRPAPAVFPRFHSGGWYLLTPP